jgi:segregation and condensation protein A
MMERPVPWWRRAISFALGGFRSGFGLFRRNGNGTNGSEAAALPQPPAQPLEVRKKTEKPEEESRVKSPSPQFEPAVAENVAAPQTETQAEVVPAPGDLPAKETAHAREAHAGEADPPAPAEPPPAATESAPEIPAAPAEPVSPAEPVAPAAEEAQPIESQAAEPAPAETLANEAEQIEETPSEPGPAEAVPGEGITEPVASATEATREGTIAPELSAEIDDLKGHDFSRAVKSQTTAGALAPEASLSSAEPEAPPASGPTEDSALAATPAQPAATAEEPAATAAIASAAVPAEEAIETAAIAAEPASAAETPAPEPETAPATEPVAAAPEPPAPQPAPAPAPPQEVAPTLPFAEKPAERTTAEKVAAALKARGENAEQSPFSVLVNQVYDGPLDLLLDLIRKQDIDIYDIPIAKITAQFLAYVDRLRSSDMDVAGEFIYTAALLIHIKSKMLLPRAPAGPDDAAEDPRRELVERLLEHERFKNAAQMLHEKQMLESATWSNPGIREFQEDAGAEPEIAADTTDLVRIFSGILERARNRPILNLEEDSVTVGQMIQFLSRRLTMEDKPVALRRMLSHTKSERALIAMFLALLELVRLQAILLRQDRHFSEIFIKKHTGFEALMNQGLADARDDWR